MNIKDIKAIYKFNLCPDTIMRVKRDQKILFDRKKYKDAIKYRCQRYKNKFRKMEN